MMRRASRLATTTTAGCAPSAKSASGKPCAPGAKLADEHNVPAYAVFSDKTLRELTERRPQSEAELRTIYGVGEMKLARYGESLLEILREAAAWFATILPCRRVMRVGLD